MRPSPPSSSSWPRSGCRCWRHSSSRTSCAQPASPSGDWWSTSAPPATRATSSPGGAPRKMRTCARWPKACRSCRAWSYRCWRAISWGAKRWKPSRPRSGRKTLDDPGVVHAAVAETVVQARRPTLPELHFLGPYPVTAPERRHRHLAGREFPLQLVQLGLQQRARSDHRALLRDPGAQLTVARPAGEIAHHLGRADPLRAAADANLALQRLPEEQHGHGRILGDLAGLATGGIGEEHEAIVVEILQQHGAGARAAVHAGRRQRAGVHLRLLHLARLPEPPAELRDRVGVEVRAAKELSAVLAPEITDVHAPLPLSVWFSSVILGRPRLQWSRFNGGWHASRRIAGDHHAAADRAGRSGGTGAARRKSGSPGVAGPPPHHRRVGEPHRRRHAHGSHDRGAGRRNRSGGGEILVGIGGWPALRLRIARA